jgi:hypothetical protein
MPIWLAAPVSLALVEEEVEELSVSSELSDDDEPVRWAELPWESTANK